MCVSVCASVSVYVCVCVCECAGRVRTRSSGAPSSCFDYCLTDKRSSLAVRPSNRSSCPTNCRWRRRWRCVGHGSCYSRRVGALTPHAPVGVGRAPRVALCSRLELSADGCRLPASFPDALTFSGSPVPFNLLCVCFGIRIACGAIFAAECTCSRLVASFRQNICYMPTRGVRM